MPANAAHTLLQSAKIEPYTHWTLAALRRVCRHLGLQLTNAALVMPLVDGMTLEELCGPDWDACLAELRPGRRGILYHPGNTRSRRFVFSVAHEVGHHVLGHPCDPPAWAESQANEFARHLLMPSQEMQEFHRRGWGPSQIARAKGVSVAAVEVRLKRLCLEAVG